MSFKFWPLLMTLTHQYISTCLKASWFKQKLIDVECIFVMKFTCRKRDEIFLISALYFQIKFQYNYSGNPSTNVMALAGLGGLSYINFHLKLGIPLALVLFLSFWGFGSCNCLKLKLLTDHHRYSYFSPRTIWMWLELKRCYFK